MGVKQGSVTKQRSFEPLDEPDGHDEEIPVEPTVPQHTTEAPSLQQQPEVEPQTSNIVHQDPSHSLHRTTPTGDNTDCQQSPQPLSKCITCSKIY